MIVKSTSLSIEGLALGRRPDVSKDVSGTSGTAIERIDGEARSIDDSYDRSVSSPHEDPSKEGLDTDGLCKDEGTVKLISLDEGVTEDSVGVETDSSGVSVRSGSGDGMEEGPGRVSLSVVREIDGVDSIDGVGAGSSDERSISETSLGLYVEAGADFGKGIIEGVKGTLDTLLGVLERIVGISEGRMLMTSTSRSIDSAILGAFLQWHCAV